MVICLWPGLPKAGPLQHLHVSNLADTMETAHSGSNAATSTFAASAVVPQVQQESYNPGKSGSNHKSIKPSSPTKN
jgi:TRAP-type C4-dicarboxylate transport system permease large subunit